MLRELRPAFVLVIALTIITGIVYPFAVTGIALVAFPYQAQGSLLERDGKVIGSALIAQQFTIGQFRRLESRPYEQSAGGTHCGRSGKAQTGELLGCSAP